MPIKKEITINKVLSNGVYDSVFNIIMTHYFKLHSCHNNTFSCVSYVNKILYDNNALSKLEYYKNKNQLIKEFITNNIKYYDNIQQLI